MGWFIIEFGLLFKDNHRWLWNIFIICWAVIEWHHDRWCPVRTQHHGRLDQSAWDRATLYPSLWYNIAGCCENSPIFIKAFLLTVRVSKTSLSFRGFWQLSVIQSYGQVSCWPAYVFAWTWRQWAADNKLFSHTSTARATVPRVWRNLADSFSQPGILSLLPLSSFVS